MSTTYATSVLDTLARFFEITAADRDIIGRAIDANTRDPQASFETIVDDPISARWRLKADSQDRRRVRLAYYPVIPPGSVAAGTLEQLVNAKLRALAAPVASAASEDGRP